MSTIRNDDDFMRLSRRARLAYERAYRALRLMSDQGLDVAAAAPMADTSMAQVERYFGGALEWDAKGRRVVRGGHRVPLPLKVPTEAGTRLVWVSDPGKRSAIGAYNNAAEAALGDNPEPLARLSHRSVVIDGERIEFVTDVRVLTELAESGQIGFEDMYELV